MEFASSKRSTVGIEWELSIVDAASGELVPAGPEIIAEADDPRVTSEFMKNTIELITGVHASIPEAIAELQTLLQRVQQIADARGLALIGPGTHPFCKSASQEISDIQRYREIIDESQSWARELAIWGVHLHVGIESRDKVIPLMQDIVEYGPVLLAMSASSPYWNGIDSGFASQRTMLFRQLPASSVPPYFADWQTFERIVDDYTRVGMIKSVASLRWDVRPSPKWGTLEIRIADGATSLARLSAVASLAHCMVEASSRRIDAHGPRPADDMLPSWFRGLNTWRAARYGHEAEFITAPDGTEEPFSAVLERRLDELAPIARQQGCEGALSHVAETVAETSSERQRRVAREHDGDLRAVVQDLISEMREPAN